MDGKVVLITGASSGIGKATALVLAQMGASLVLLCRHPDRAAAAAAEIKRQAPGSNVEVLIADLACQRQVRAAAREYLASGRPLHVLINNAGLILRHRETTEDGYETTFAVNHLAHFLLTDLLLERICASAPARIINVASRLHKIGQIHFDDLHMTTKYGFMAAYAQSKLANILFTRELARRIAGSGVTVNAATPGLVASGFARNNGGLTRMVMKTLAPFMRSPETGARTIVYLSASPHVATTTGAYFADCRPQGVSAGACNDRDARKLWQISTAMTVPDTHPKI